MTPVLGGHFFLRPSHFLVAAWVVLGSTERTRDGSGLP